MPTTDEVELRREFLDRLADTVHNLSSDMQYMLESGISRDVLVLLIKNASSGRPTIAQVNAVIDGMEALDEYCFPTPTES